MAHTTKKTSKKVKAFLETLRLTANVSKSCQAVLIDRSTAYRWREEDEEFAKAWDEAIEAGYDDLEEEARRRAFEGIIRKKFDKGEPVIDPLTGEQYYEREYSDTLTIFLLKGGRPDKYRERYEHSGPGGGAIPVTISDLLKKVYAEDEDIIDPGGEEI
jgi:hypothetical protein